MFLQLIVNGLIDGSVLALGAVGLNLVLGILRFFNFAQGDLLTVGAYAAFVVNGTLHLSVVLGAAAAVIVTAVLALLLEYVLWRPLRRRGSGSVSLLIVSVGLALIIRNGIGWVWSNAPRRYNVNVFQAYSWGPLRVSQSQIIVVIAAVLACGLVAVLLTRTTFGKQMRAMADNHDLAEISGIRTEYIIAVTWLAAGALAGLSGFLQALLQASFDPNEGADLLLPIFAAVVLGGLGDAFGALLGGIVIGLATDLCTWHGFFGGVPTSYSPIVAFIVLLLVLALRPRGLLTRRALAG